LKKNPYFQDSMFAVYVTTSLSFGRTFSIHPV